MSSIIYIIYIYFLLVLFFVFAEKIACAKLPYWGAYFFAKTDRLLVNKIRIPVINKSIR